MTTTNPPQFWAALSKEYLWENTFGDTVITRFLIIYDVREQRCCPPELQRTGLGLVWAAGLGLDLV